jgi:hypothetical protein
MSSTRSAFILLLFLVASLHELGTMLYFCLSICNFTAQIEPVQVKCIVMAPTIIRGRTRRCRDCMVVGFITTYICNQCLSPLTLWVRIPLRRAALYTTLCDKVCQWLGGFLQVLRFAPSIKLTAILLKVALSTITLTPQYNTVKLISI